jgi:hypothetical protein
MCHPDQHRDLPGLSATIARADTPNGRAFAIDLSRGSEVWPESGGTPHCCSGEGARSSCCVLTRAGHTQARRDNSGTRPLTLTPCHPP